MGTQDILNSIREHASAVAALTRGDIRTGTTLRSVFERSAAAVTLRPAVGQGTDSTTVGMIDATTCEAKQGPWKLTAESDPKLGGSDKHPGPGFLLRAALGACFVQTAALWSAKLEVPIDRLEVEVIHEHDARGLLGVGETAPRFRRLRYRITVSSAAPEEEVRRVLDAAHSHSPVQNSLEHAFSIAREVQLNEPCTPSDTD